jgi:4-amino-4-deoxy-L-arabinose transferase-like glycosyltransferase
MNTSIHIFLIVSILSILIPPFVLFGPRNISKYISLNFFTENKILPLLLLTGIVLGLNNISQILWYDETFFTFVKNYPILNGLANIFYDVHPPLYRIINLPIIYIFGDSEKVIRFIPLCSFSISIWLIYTLIEILFSKKSAIIGSIFFVLSPFSINFAQEARVYSFLIMVFLFILHILFNQEVVHRYFKFQIFGILLELFLNKE